MKATNPTHKNKPHLVQTTRYCPTAMTAVESAPLMNSSCASVGQTQNPLRDDVQLHFRRSARDRGGFLTQPCPRRGDFLVGERLAFPTDAFESHRRDREFGAFLREDCTGQLHGRRSETGSPRLRFL